MGETLADWCYSVRPGQKSSTSLSTPHHLLQVEGIQWILRQSERQRERKKRAVFFSVRQGGIYSL